MDITADQQVSTTQPSTNTSSLPGIKFTQRPKISIFDPKGRHVAPIHVKLGMFEWQLRPLGRAKFLANRWTGVGTQPPKVEKFPLFDRVAPLGEPFDRFFFTNVRGFCASNHPTELF